MPRANRYILPGHTYHLTHRCHNRSFLFRFARDRTEYQRRLRSAVKEYKISLLTYCITSNHTHLIARAKDAESIAVGSETFVRLIEQDVGNRVELTVEEVGLSQWIVREARTAYG